MRKEGLIPHRGSQVGHSDELHSARPCASGRSQGGVSALLWSVVSVTEPGWEVSATAPQTRMVVDSGSDMELSISSLGLIVEVMLFRVGFCS